MAASTSATPNMVASVCPGHDVARIAQVGGKPTIEFAPLFVGEIDFIRLCRDLIPKGLNPQYLLRNTL